MDKILLIVGCSHAAGAEIDGTTDSSFNRQNSFGNILAEKLNRTAVNIASSGSTNSSILRNTIEYVENHQSKDMIILISWTESTRVEIPIPEHRTSDWEKINNFSRYISDQNKHFLRLNYGWKGISDWEKEIIERVHPVMIHHDLYFEISSAQMVLLLHLYLKTKNIDHMMCNSMYMFSKDFRLLPYLNLIDKRNYFNMLDNEASFYPKYKNLGYSNIKAEYWHHGPEPHKLYAEELFEYIHANR